jgi:hypothetical protein
VLVCRQRGSGRQEARFPERSAGLFRMRLSGESYGRGIRAALPRQSLLLCAHRRTAIDSDFGLRGIDKQLPDLPNCGRCLTA